MDSFEFIHGIAEKQTRDSFALTAYGDGVKDERMRIINLLAADCNHAEPWCYHRGVIKLIGEGM